jgi:cobalamin biosynthesis protein CobD/CbiB
MNRLPVFIQKLISNPRRLFLLDGLGAFLTGLLLLAIGANFEPVFGVPKRVVYPLAIIAFLFFMYSGSCFLAVKRWRPYLTGIALANLSYCAASIAVLFYHRQHVTILGWGYFLTESAVVGSLVAIELAAVSQFGNRS